MMYCYWIIAYAGCPLCPWRPGMALCETPSWECPWINLGLAQDCLGLLGDGVGLAVTACFGGVRAIGWPNCPWLRLRKQEADKPHPQWNHLQPELFLDSKTRTHKWDDREKPVVENYTTGSQQLVMMMMMPWLDTVRNLSNLSSRWIHQIKRVWDDDKSLQVQWGCSSLIQG